LVDALICYKQKCKVASFNLAHPVCSKFSTKKALRCTFSRAEFKNYLEVRHSSHLCRRIVQPFQI